MTASQCLKCGVTAVHERWVDEAVERNGKIKFISDRQMFCGSCENVCYEGDQISEHERARADAIRELEELLAPDELFHIRTKYRLEPTDLERMLSTGPGTWRRWERGKIPQSKEADTMIRFIADDPRVGLGPLLQALLDNAEADPSARLIGQDAEAQMRLVP